MTTILNNLLPHFKICFSRKIRYLFGAIFAFGASFCFCLVGMGSNQATRNKIASLISSAADETESGFLNLSLTSLSSDSLPGYYDVFFLADNIRSMNFNRTGYRSYSGFSQNNDLFAHNFEYSILGHDISILCSAVNSINLKDGIYSHEIWGGNFMFAPHGFTVNEGDTNFCYIPKFLADELLANDPSLDGYDSLIGKSIQIEFADKLNRNNSQSLHWTVLNIFENNETSEYLSNQFGLYLCCYNSLPTYKFPSVYIQFGHSQYTNKLYLDWLKEHVDFSEYSLGINDDASPYFDLRLFSDEYTNNYFDGLSNSSLVLILSSLLAVAIVAESFFLISKYHLKSWLFAFANLGGVCFALLFVTIFSFLPFGQCPIAIYFSAAYIPVAAIAAFITKKYIVCGRRRVIYFESDTVRI